MTVMASAIGHPRRPHSKKKTPTSVFDSLINGKVVAVDLGSIFFILYLLAPDSRGLSSIVDGYVGRGSLSLSFNFIWLLPCCHYVCKRVVHWTTGDHSRPMIP